jgi:hypothetical protein
MSRERASVAAATLLAITVLWLGIQYGSTTAGGADSLGYVMQAGLWQTGSLRIQQDVVSESPWPFAAATWTPLGFVASSAMPDAIVPSYAPGYPLLIAMAQIAGGYCAGFVVVPVCGALAILAIYALGRRVFEGHTRALGGAALLAASPVFLYQLMNPMSDVPVTAAWTMALASAVWNLPLCAGLAAGAAVAIRPNLVAVVVVLFAWLALTDRRAVLRAGLGVAPAIVGIAWLNARLYGSPFTSGYGALADLYAVTNLPSNVRLFTIWTLDAQTPLVSLAALYFIVPRWFAGRQAPSPGILLGGTIAVVVASYLFYQPFDAWWYLRFLLPAWPVLLLTAAAGIDALARRCGGSVHLPLTVVVLALWCSYGVYFASARDALDLGRGERVYADVGRYIAEHTEPAAVMLSFQHSGSLRLYADRLTLRYERLEPSWLDRAIAHLQGSGRHPYIVVTEQEEAEFRRRFAPVSSIGALDWKPIAVYATPRVAVYDAINPGGTSETMGISATGRGRARRRCDPPQIWPPRLRMK